MLIFKVVTVFKAKHAILSQASANMCKRNWAHPDLILR